MTNYAYDFAAARPNQATLASGVAVGVCRYLKKSLPNQYDLTKAERDQYLSWGLGVLYNAEQAAGDLIEQGQKYFVDYGQMISAKLQSWGVPTDQGINVALSSDTNVSDAQIPTVMNNYSAFAASVAPYGCIGYAQTQIIDLLVAEGISPPGAKHWLPGAISWSRIYPNTTAGWNAYMAYPHAGIVQMLGSNIGGTDMNYLIDVAHTGFHWPAGSPYIPTPKDDDMVHLHVDDGAGHTYIVRSDLSSKTHIWSPQDDASITALQRAADPHIWESMFLTPEQLNQIPDAISLIPPAPTPATIDYPQLSAALVAAGVSSGLTTDQVDALIDAAIARLKITESS